MNAPDDNRVCQGCGALLPHYVGEGLCARCIARFSLMEGVGLRSDDPASESSAGAPVPPAQIRFGDYELLEEVAHGGMGVVYRAQQVSLNRIVAVKMLLFGQFAGKAAFDRFRAEAETTARLQHPNIVAIHEIGQADGQPYFSMDYVAGRNLSDIVKDHPLPGQQAARYLREIAQAVHYAHTQGVLHRDLKPANILIDQSDEPRVTDFGLARRLAGDSEFTLTGQVIGSPNFMPPEQGAGKHAKAGPEIDVYGLGAVLYYLLTARPPFAAETFEATLEQVLHVQPVAPRQLNPSVPRDLETICLKCLQKEPKRRYGSAAQVGDEMDRFLNGEPIRARPLGAAAKSWRWCRRNPRVALATAAALLSLVLGLAGVSWEWRISERQRLRAEAESQRVQRHSYVSDMNLVQRSLQEHNLGRAQSLLDRHRPGRGQMDLRHWEWRYFWDQCRSEALFKVGQHSNAIEALAFVNTGRWLAVGDIDGSVRLWDVAARQEVARLQDGGQCWSMAAADHGNLLAAGGTDAQGKGVVRLWDVPARRLLAQLALEKPVKSLIFAPDASRLLLWEHNRYVKLWEFGSQKPVVDVVPSPRRMRYGGVVLFTPDGRWLVIGDGDGNVRFFDGSGTRCVLGFKAHPYAITALAFSPDGTLLASAGTLSETVIKLWAVDSGKEVGRLTGHRSWVSSLLFGADGRTLVSAGGDQTIRFWDVVTHSETAVYQGHLSDVFALACAPDGSMLVSGAGDGSVLAWNVRPVAKSRPPGSFPARFRGAGGFLAFAPDSQSFAVLTPDGGVVRRRTSDLREIEVLAALGNSNSVLACSASGRFLAAGDDLGRVKIWDFTRAALAAILNAHTGMVFFIRFTADERALIAADLNKVQVLAAPDWRESSSWPIDFEFEGATLSPDGERIAFALNERVATIWNVRSGQRQLTVGGHKDRLRGVAFSPDNRYLLTSSEDGTSRLWDLATSRAEVLPFGMQSVTFSPDSQRLIIGRAGTEAIKLFDRFTLRETVTLQADGSAMSGVCVSPDGNVIASVSIEGKAYIWRAPSWAEIDAEETRQAASP
ncbi:MAG: protein kinase [Verrucomicrobiia bacterium]